jgi:hypothetical protein
MSTRYIEIKQSLTRWPSKRAQKWYFIIRSAGNRKPVAVSSMYTNRQDCVDEARRIGSSDTTFILLQPEQDDETLQDKNQQT